MSKAIGIIASPAAVLDLLARHADDADPHRPPWEQVAAHHDDDTDPWAEDLPAAGWQSAAHGNYHQPALDDTSWWDTPHPDRPGPDQPGPDHPGPEPDEAPIDPDDLSWYRDHPVGTGSEGIDAPGSASGDTTLYRTGDLQVESATSAGAAHPAPEEPVPVSSRWPQPFRPPGWQPLTPAQRAACAPRVVLHVHLSEQTLRDHHGVVRTDTGPILLEQLHRYLVQHDATITVQPVLDPATAAPADAYEIPLRLRRAMAIRHPRSVFPHSPTTSRTDLDHTRPYHRDGPPGQTSMANLGPLTRAEHRAKTLGRWRSKQPEPGTYLWRSPQNWIMITTNQGTLTLGHSTWAHHLWNTTT
jgi:hypothetical protein